MLSGRGRSGPFSVSDHWRRSQHVGGFDAREMHLVGVHQEACAIVIDGEAEMIGDAFVHFEPCRPAEGGCEINALLPVG